MRVVLLAIYSMLLGALGVVVFFGLCFVMGALGAGMLGFRIFTAPAYTMGPLFSFLTGLLPHWVVRALVGTSSVGSSLGLLGLWSMLSWFILFSLIALLVLRKRARRRGMAASPGRGSSP